MLTHECIILKGDLNDNISQPSSKSIDIHACNT